MTQVSCGGDVVCQFDWKFYIKAYRDVNMRWTNPLEHYNKIGLAEDRLPNEQRFSQLYPQFSFDVYIKNNPDISKFTKEELMCHFHHYGRFELRQYR